MNNLHRAADMLEAGWCRSELAQTGNDGDKFCAMGAVAAAALGLTAEDIAADDKLENALYSFLDNLPEIKVLADTIADAGNYRSKWPTSTVYSFNDEQRSKEPVVAMVRKAAERMDAQA